MKVGFPPETESPSEKHFVFGFAAVRSDRLVDSILNERPVDFQISCRKKAWAECWTAAAEAGEKSSEDQVHHEDGSSGTNAYLNEDGLGKLERESVGAYERHHQQHLAEVLKR